VALSEIDRNLLTRCLARKPRAWDDFVDRFMGLVLHVIDHSAQSRGRMLSAADREDIAAEVFLALVKDDLAVLRRFRGESSLATYLTVITRRVVVAELMKPRSTIIHSSALPLAHQQNVANHHAGTEEIPFIRISDHDEVRQLLDELETTEAQVVRMYHLEGRSYQEISTLVGMPVNSIGPTLSRAREKMRRAGVE
jgi:RNA polymerase sigma-70 factor (ECF subfamily)